LKILGIDIGGSGIKGAPVNVDRGAELAERFRVPTPNPARPKAVAAVVAEVARHFDWHGPIGCTFPGVVQAGIVRTGVHMHKSWLGRDGRRLLEERTGCPVLLLNDADAAGVAEMTHGAGKGVQGVVILVTLGTGIGSALFWEGRLVPNTELGHIEVNGKDAEYRASDHARVVKRMSWKRWARHLDDYLGRLNQMFTPDLIIIGGGVSKDYQKFLPLLHTRATIVPAKLRNEAGIIGAALAARALIAGAAPPSARAAAEAATAETGAEALAEEVATRGRPMPE
jgi:polyphosphate glucokinase